MKQISIKIKFGVLVGILIFIVVIAISTTLLNQEKKVLVERIQRQGLILSKNLASSAAEGITTSDELVIYQTIEDIIRQEEKEAIKEAFVLDTTGKIIAHNNIKKVGQSLDTRSWESDIKKESQKPRLFEKDNELLYDFMTPIFLKTFKKGVLKRVLIGSAHIIYSYKVVQKALNKATLSVFFISFLILAAGIGASFLLTRFIVSPIMKIAHGAQQIGNGNLQYKISVNTKDELEFLSNQFNIMTEKLEEAQKIMLKQERLKYELDIATGIQNSLIPQKIPSIKNMALSAYYSPAKEIGGDYYDFYKIDNNKLGIIMADVSGKGVPAAMIMVMVRSILKSQVFSAKTAFHTLVNTNRLISGDIKRGMFITAFYGILDTSRSILQFVNAGHNPLLLARKKTGKIEKYQEPGIPLGTQTPAVFEEALRGKFLRLEQGDLIVQYTDGITEAKNGKNDEYGLQRLMNVIQKNKDLKTNDLIKQVLKDIKQFCQATPQYDDIAIIAIRV